MNKASATSSGILYIVATPIGNLDDISKRAIETLAAVDAILAEDTRHSSHLLQALGIKRPVYSLHAHNESSKTETFISQLLEGKNLALISDAGTPLISDPGYPLVHLAREKGITVSSIPGPCALIAALSAAGVPCDTFTFAGFLPAKEAARIARLKELSQIEHSLVFYESTHRILDCLTDLACVFGAFCPLVLAKELTKSYERYISGTCESIKATLEADSQLQKGEFVLILPAREKQSNDIKEDAILAILLKELPLKQAVKIAAELTGGRKNDLYQKALLLAGE